MISTFKANNQRFPEFTHYWILKWSLNELFIFYIFKFGPYFLAFSCPAQNSEYYYKSGDRFGTGKWYMGREIAHVMGYQGINWLERPEREKEENTSKLLKNMDIQSEDVIADIGAGSGYHVLKLNLKPKRGNLCRRYSRRNASSH